MMPVPLLPMFHEPIALLDGRWRATQGRLGGVRLLPEALRELSLTFDNGDFSFGADHGRATLDVDVFPAAVDIVVLAGPNRGRILPTIVDYSRTQLLICLDLSGRERPQSFAAPLGTRHFLAIYRRTLDVEPFGTGDAGGYSRASIIRSRQLVSHGKRRPRNARR